MRKMVFIESCVICVLAWLLLKRVDPPQQTSQPSTEPMRSVKIDAPTSFSNRVLQFKNKIESGSHGKINWSNIESADYLEYIDNLKRIGCPDKTIKDIVAADIYDLYESKKRLEVSPLFEKARLRGGWISPQELEDFTKKFNSLQQERDEVCQHLLGTSLPKSNSDEFLKLLPHLVLKTNDPTKWFIIPEAGEVARWKIGDGPL